MKNVTTTPDAHALVHAIKCVIDVHGILFCNQNAVNTILLANLGMTAATQRRIIDDLDIGDYVIRSAPGNLYPWRLVANFYKKYNGTSLDIKISVGIECAPAVCLEFIPQQLRI